MALLTSTRRRPGGSPSASPRRRPPTRVLLLAAAVGAVLAVVGTMLMPPARLSGARSGDPALAADLEAAMAPRGPIAPGDGGFVTVSAGRIADGRATFAGLGRPVPAPETTYELGSITKTFTAMLLADAVQRGEMRLDDPVSTYLPELADTPAGASTLRQLATHTSGLPSLPPMGLPATWRAATGGNPYQGWDAPRVIAAAGKITISKRGVYAYSNLGVSLLGLAEARATDAPDWPTLARQRLLIPLGMTHTSFVPNAAAPDPAMRPHRTNGWPVDPWSGSGFVAAGVATRTTAADLLRYAQAILDGTAPGLAALTPTTDIGHGERIGLVWMTTIIDGRPVVWHNGGTGGSRTMIALDLQAHRAVVVLGNSARWVDTLALRALLPHDRALVTAPSASLPTLVFGGVALLFVLQLAMTAFRADNRLQTASALLTGTLGLALALVHGPWGYVPGWLFGVLAGVAGAAAVLALLRAAHLPTRPKRRAVRTVAGAVVTLALLIAVLASA